MKSVAASARYAKSLIDLALENKELKAIKSDITTLESALQSSEFKAFINSPIIKKDKKNQIFAALFGGKLNNITLSFLNLLALKGRENLLPGILISFVDQYNVINNITKATVITATGLNDDLRKKVNELVKSLNNTEVEIQEKVNPEIIGGFILNIGNSQYDNSVLRSLQTVKNKFTNN